MGRCRNTKTRYEQALWHVGTFVLRVVVIHLWKGVVIGLVWGVDLMGCFFVLFFFSLTMTITKQCPLVVMLATFQEESEGITVETQDYWVEDAAADMLLVTHEDEDDQEKANEIAAILRQTIGKMWAWGRCFGGESTILHIDHLFLLVVCVRVGQNAQISEKRGWHSTY